MSLQLSPERTALVLIDLQEGIISLPTTPYSGEEIVQRSKQVAASFRKAGDRKSVV